MCCCDVPLRIILRCLNRARFSNCQHLCERPNSVPPKILRAHSTCSSMRCSATLRRGCAGRVGQLQLRGWPCHQQARRQWYQRSWLALQHQLHRAHLREEACVRWRAAYGKECKVSLGLVESPLRWRKRRRRVPTSLYQAERSGAKAAVIATSKSSATAAVLNGGVQSSRQVGRRGEASQSTYLPARKAWRLRSSSAIVGRRRRGAASRAHSPFKYVRTYVRTVRTYNCTYIIIIIIQELIR